ncbi:MAG TPA: twin-arginine translocation signal domain-containing protein [Myxococcota bacterium]|nr:twin-arginine translocation signal domain-containing protein [Myxococcota bacterium]
MERRNFLKGVLGGCLGAAGIALGARAENDDSPLRRPGGGAVRDDSPRDDARLVDLFAHPWWDMKGRRSSNHLIIREMGDLPIAQR